LAPTHETLYDSIERFVSQNSGLRSHEYREAIQLLNRLKMWDIAELLFNDAAKRCRLSPDVCMEYLKLLYTALRSRKQRRYNPKEEQRMVNRVKEMMSLVEVAPNRAALSTADYYQGVTRCYLHCGKISEAQKLVGAISSQQQNLKTAHYNVIIECAGTQDEALQVLRTMLRRNVSIRQDTYVALVKSIWRTSGWKDAMAVPKIASENGHTIAATTSNQILKMLGSEVTAGVDAIEVNEEACEQMLSFFNNRRNPRDETSYEIVIKALSAIRRWREMLDVFHEFFETNSLRRHVNTELRLFNIVLESLRTVNRLEVAESILTSMLQRPYLKPNFEIYKNMFIIKYDLAKYKTAERYLAELLNLLPEESVGKSNSEGQDLDSPTSNQAITISEELLLKMLRLSRISGGDKRRDEVYAEIYRKGLRDHWGDWNLWELDLRGWSPVAAVCAVRHAFLFELRDSEGKDTPLIDFTIQYTPYWERDGQGIDCQTRNMSEKSPQSNADTKKVDGDQSANHNGFSNPVRAKVLFRALRSDIHPVLELQHVRRGVALIPGERMRKWLKMKAGNYYLGGGTRDWGFNIFSLDE